MAAIDEAWTAKETRERKRFNILVQCITGVNPEQEETTPEAEFSKLTSYMTKK